MSTFEAELSRRLEHLREQGLHRELRRLEGPQSRQVNFQGRTLLNFSSNDYLGLANDPVLREAAIRAIEKYGSGSGASRLICGSLAPHHELEEALADFKGAEAALSFASGYAAALGTLSALVGKADILLLDKRVHASIVDAARLCGAKLRVFHHNDLTDLETLLEWARRQADERPVAATSERPRILVVTESVFSMDGDFAPLDRIVELKNRYGAWLMVDEAHATGLYGPHRRGLADALSVSHQIEVQMGTLGKALGASGGYICGSKTLVSYLVNRARSFIFSTAPAPAAAAAATAAIRFVQSADGAARLRQLWERVEQLPEWLLPKAARAAPETSPSLPRAFLPAIVPIIVGGESEAVAAAAFLREQGIFIPAVRYPTVARGQARLRLTLTAAHEPGDVAQLMRALQEAGLAVAPKVEHLA